MKTETYNMQQAAKMCSIGSKKLFALLREKGILNTENLPYLKYRETGYFTMHTSRWVHPVRGEMARSKAMVTPKGIELINNVIQQKINATANQKKCG